MSYRSIIVILTSIVLFMAWQLVDHIYYMKMPMPAHHVLSFVVNSTLALAIAGFATLEISRQYYQLRQLEKTRDDLTHMVVHDLRTPLTSIIGSLQTMQMGTFGDLNPDMAEFVDISVKSGEHMLSMVNDLLDISKMEAGPVNLDTEQTLISDLAASALEEVKYLAQEKNIQLGSSVQPENLAIRCDIDKIRRVIINLLGNAFKFTPEAGSVNISAEGDSSGITISVTDTGEGITEEYKEKIFEKFGQVESRKAGRRHSTGLGLTFCKLAVEAHQGRIWVESTPGVGSTFKFTLPFIGKRGRRGC